MWKISRNAVTGDRDHFFYGKSSKITNMDDMSISLGVIHQGNKYIKFNELNLDCMRSTIIQTWVVGDDDVSDMPGQADSGSVDVGDTDVGQTKQSDEVMDSGPILESDARSSSSRLSSLRKGRRHEKKGEQREGRSDCWWTHHMQVNGKEALKKRIGKKMWGPQTAIGNAEEAGLISLC